MGGAHKEMMLNTDLCLLYSKNDVKDCSDARGNEWDNDSETDVRQTECRWNELYGSSGDLKSATANDCCAWVK